MTDLSIAHSSRVAPLPTMGQTTSEQNRVESMEQVLPGYRYTAKQLGDELKKWAKNGLKDEITGQAEFLALNPNQQNLVCFSMFKIKEQAFILLTPVRDSIRPIASAVELLSLYQALDMLFKREDCQKFRLDNQQYKLIVPLSIASAKHWVTLEISFNGDGRAHAELFDSKPNFFRILRNFWNILVNMLTNSHDSHSDIKLTLDQCLKSKDSFSKEDDEMGWEIVDYMKGLGIKEVIFKERGYNHQSVLDNKNCGYYTGERIKRSILENASLIAVA